MNHSEERPNIDAFADALQAAADQSRKFDNLPQFQQGNAILQSLADVKQQMQTMQQQMQTMQQQMQTMQGQLNNRLDGLERRLDASEHNNTARLYNSFRRADEQIAPLHNREDQPIAGFPTTIGQIDSMPAAQLNILLQNLNHDTQGGITQRRSRLKKAVGIMIQQQLID